jgi:curved DNA-binding protein CbpA
MKDPYETLGVNRSATDKEIKDAFKKMARKFHPDLHPGDKEAEAKFKDISAANDLLKDGEKRRRFDAGEIDARARSGRRNGSIATSPTGPPTPRMPRRTDSTATRIWKNFWQRRLPAGVNAHATRSGHAARM